ncbi:hypothetical protein MBO12_02460 [Candidatus Saccharibacteria bacterium]|nr:hypothetical protein [Candidatus Saccharibacteria bacterium]
MAGYDWSKGKSNNAVWAEEEGMRTKSKITAKWLREGGITEKVGFVKFLIKANRIRATERHHTSKYFNETSYYSTEDIAEQLENLSPIWREIYADPKLRNSSKRDIRRAFSLKNACELYNSSDADIFDVRRGVVWTDINEVIIVNFTITIDWPGGQIIAKNIYEAESQIRSLQTFGSYPMWSWTDSWKPPEGEYNKFYGVSGWQRFDNAYIDQLLRDGYFQWLPVTAVRDLRQYLVWSLSGAIELSDVKVTIDGDFKLDER